MPEECYNKEDILHEGVFPMFHFLTTTADSTATGSVGMMSSLIMIAVMFAVMYFILIRPENKRKKEAEQMRSAMKVGDKVTTIGGIVGKVVDIKEDKFVIESGADQVRIELFKWALSTNETAAEAAKAKQKKAEEAKAKAKAAKKAEKN